MKPRILLAVGGVAVLVGAAAWLWHARSERDRLRAESIAVASSTALQRARLVAARSALAAKQERRTQLEQALSASTKSSSASASTAPRKESARTEARKWSEFLSERHKEKVDPKTQLADAGLRKARLGERYAQFYRLAQLSEEAVNRFEDIRVRREMNHGDLNAAAREEGLDLNDPGIVRMRGEIYREHDDALQSLLGGPGFAAFQNFERTAGVRELVGNVAGAAVVEGIRFTPEQAETLVQVLANASGSYGRGQNATGSDIDWSAAEPELRRILSPAQLTFVQTMEAPGGVFHARWNGELVKAMDEERKRAGKR